MIVCFEYLVQDVMFKCSILCQCIKVNGFGNPISCVHNKNTKNTLYDSILYHIHMKQTIYHKKYKRYTHWGHLYTLHYSDEE